MVRLNNLRQVPATISISNFSRNNKKQLSRLGGRLLLYQQNLSRRSNMPNALNVHFAKKTPQYCWHLRKVIICVLTVMPSDLLKAL